MRGQKKRSFSPKNYVQFCVAYFEAQLATIDVLSVDFVCIILADGASSYSAVG